MPSFSQSQMQTLQGHVDSVNKYMAGGNQTAWIKVGI